MSKNDLIEEQIKNLISLFTSGKINETLKIAVALSTNNSENAILHNIIGACYSGLNQHNKAINSYQKAILIKPNYVEALFNLALTYQNLGNFEESVDCYKNALAYKQDYFEALNNLGSVYRSLGQINNSIESYKDAIKFNEKYIEAHFNLGDLYRELNETSLAIKHFNMVLLNNPNFFELHNNIAVLYSEKNELEFAEEHLNKALKINPDFSEAHNNLSNIFLETNRIDDAILGYEKALVIDKNYAEAYYNLSKITKYTLSEKKIKHIHLMLNNSSLSPNDRVYLYFSLAQFYEKIKINDKFIKFLNKANKLQADILNYSLNKDEKLILQIKNLFLSQPKALEEVKDLQPIFIVGMPRSGTSLVEQIIASHYKVYGGGELTIVPDIVEPLLDMLLQNNQTILSTQNLVSIRMQYIEMTSSFKIKEKIITDKMPLNFQYIGIILSAFPEAKIINLNRNAIATCWSNYRCLFSDGANSYSYNFENLIEFYKLYKDLMEFWHEKYPNRIYDISYEELTSNQEEETRKLLNYCELDWDENCLNFHNNKRAVKTASSLQVRKKMYQGSSEAWKKYEDYLQPLIKGLN